MLHSVAYEQTVRYVAFCTKKRPLSVRQEPFLYFSRLFGFVRFHETNEQGASGKLGAFPIYLNHSPGL